MTQAAQEGDLVYLFSQDYKTFQVTLKAGARTHTHRGIVDHDDLIGQPLGRKIRSHLGHTFWVMIPSTYDLIRGARRVTQIMFPKDIGYLLLRLNVHPGVRVIEAGTGSGGLSIALARAVQPDGRVYSYEHRAEIQEVARENLERLGLLPWVDLIVRDIAEGFDQAEVDALFLDVRAPWEYLAQAHAALKPGGFFGAILPTTNQVSRLLDALRQSGFAGLEMEELILRPYKAVPARLRPMDRIIAHTGYLVFARKVLDVDGEDWLATNRGRTRAAERGEQDDYW
jgi:tRNA (adenine57-N1/adenine58-N1)-methyltransferase catalytic subunit